MQAMWSQAVCETGEESKVLLQVQAGIYCFLTSRINRIRKNLDVSGVWHLQQSLRCPVCGHFPQRQEAGS